MDNSEDESARSCKGLHRKTPHDTNQPAFQSAKLFEDVFHRGALNSPTTGYPKALRALMQIQCLGQRPKTETDTTYGSINSKRS